MPRTHHETLGYRKLTAFVARPNGVPMEEALRRADECNLVIASNKRLSTALIGSKEGKDIAWTFPCWTGTMAAYDAPGKELGKIIGYTDPETGVRYVFPVPGDHQGKMDVILIAEHPCFTILKDGRDRVIIADAIDAVEHFPASGMRSYVAEEEHDIPNGTPVRMNKHGARFLLRAEKRVGLIARGCFKKNVPSDRGVDIRSEPSCSFGVAVETPRAGAPLFIRQESGRLIVEGTPEQVTAAAKLIEQMMIEQMKVR